MTHVNLLLLDARHARLLADTAVSGGKNKGHAMLGEQDKAHPIPGGMLTGAGGAKFFERLARQLREGFHDFDTAAHCFADEVQCAGDDDVLETAAQLGIKGDREDVIGGAARQPKARKTFESTAVLVGYSTMRETMECHVALYRPGADIEVQSSEPFQMWASESQAAIAALGRRGKSVPASLEDHVAMLRGQHVFAMKHMKRRSGRIPMVAGKGRIIAWDITPEGIERTDAGALAKQKRWGK